MAESEELYKIVWSPKLRDAAPRGLCTDCGVSRTTEAKRCAAACQFIKPDYPGAETRVHGRTRNPSKGDELHFGPYQSLLKASLKQPAEGAQWTGITTRLAERLLATGAVDAVLAVAPDDTDRWKPKPVIVTDAAGMAQCRGMRMGYAPTLALIEPALQAGHRRLAMVGIPCQVYALRALEQSYKDQGQLDSLHVIGTPCSDNTTTENFHLFLSRLSDEPETINYLEFRADYHVEIRFDDGRVKQMPFLKLPLSDLPANFFPTTCRTCVDYTNALADITVGYMGGEGEQWLIVRNARGQSMLDLLGDEVALAEPGERGKRMGSVKGFIANTERAAGGLPLRAMPDWLRPVVAWLMPKVGPRGREFARARVEMKAAECVLHLRRLHPQRMKSMVPEHIWSQLAAYGIEPAAKERREHTAHSGSPDER